MNIHVEAESVMSGRIPLIDLDLLKTLVAISQTGNFSAAAEIVHRTPSAISMQVKRIEDMLGRQIFVRSARSVALNEDGEILLAHARRVLAMNREVVAKFIAPEISGVVRLGAVDHITEQFLPAALCRFKNSHPGIKVEVTVENSEPLSRKYRAGQFDIALVTCNPDRIAGEDIELFYREKLVWAGLKTGVAVEETPLPVSVWEEGCAWRENALAGLQQQGRDYHITFKSDHIAGQKAGLLADLAIAPLPASACGGQIVELGPEHGLPPLGDTFFGILIVKDASEHVLAVADQLRADFANMGK